MAGLPIRWAFHVWLTGGQWEFKRWRDYLLRMEEADCLHDYDCVGTKKVFRIFTKPDFRLYVIHFLDWHKASTLAGFIRWYQGELKNYEKLLRQEGII